MENNYLLSEKNESLAFSPYRLVRFFSIFEGLAAVLFIMIVILFDSPIGTEVLLLLFFALSLYFAYYLWELSTLCITVNSSGVMLSTNKRNKASFVWEDFVAAYILHDFKGFTYLLLANKKMDKRTCKRMMNRMMLVIKMDSLQLTINGNVGFRAETHLQEILSFISPKVEIIKIE